MVQSTIITGIAVGIVEVICCAVDSTTNCTQHALFLCTFGGRDLRNITMVWILTSWIWGAMSGQVLMVQAMGFPNLHFLVFNLHGRA